ncbi:hypothetical protein TL16_g04269 [Triparma laevis f. inornata]|uniref:Uncharacterized protein n=1 Tax=Triparma laevis f. inornata TaxID=1714386 RepID=A0A9W7A8V4_9STRA|nr:hypothetical protein TL16_g04269 [Triparma laevis f. inornata]
MNFCPTCGAKGNGGAFCTQCGTALKQESQPGPLVADEVKQDTKVFPDTIPTPVYTAFPVTSTPMYTALPLAPVGTPGVGVVAGVAQNNKADTVKGSGGPGMCLVKKGDKHQLRLKFAPNLRSGESVPALLGGVHDGMAIGREYLEEKIHGEWRYTESALGPGTGVQLKFERGEFLKLQDSDLVLDVSFWKMTEGTPVNFVGGNGERTYLKGGGQEGRSWVVNNDGTISPKNYSNLVLGAAVPIKATELAGCWNCCCFPCGAAALNITPESDDVYQECGLFFWFFVIPIPYGKKRKRKSAKQFVNTEDAGDVAMFENSNKIYFPPGVAGCGGRC